MKAKASTYPFDVEFFDEDFTGNMSWHVLGQRLLRAAAQHAHDRGFECVVNNGHPCLWVLSRMVVEMNRMPRSLEKGTITTWITSGYRSFTDRCFVMKDSLGRELGRAATVWALIDSESREPVNLHNVLGADFEGCFDADRRVELGRPMRFTANQMSLVAERKVCCSDLDKNGHLNSIRYIDYVLDTFSRKKLEASFPFRMELAYSHESMYGDVVQIFGKECAVTDASTEGNENIIYQFALKNGEHTACQCALRFKNRIKNNQTF